MWANSIFNSQSNGMRLGDLNPGMRGLWCGYLHWSPWVFSGNNNNNNCATNCASNCASNAGSAVALRVVYWCSGFFKTLFCQPVGPFCATIMRKYMSCQRRGCLAGLVANTRLTNTLHRYEWGVYPSHS